MLFYSCFNRLIFSTSSKLSSYSCSEFFPRFRFLFMGTGSNRAGFPFFPYLVHVILEIAYLFHWSTCSDSCQDTLLWENVVSVPASSDGVMQSSHFELSSSTALLLSPPYTRFGIILSPPWNTLSAALCRLWQHLKQLPSPESRRLVFHFLSSAILRSKCVTIRKHEVDSHMSGFQCVMLCFPVRINCYISVLF